MLMSQSLNNLEIAQRLVISPETVKSHVQRIMTKLQARDRLQAVLQGIRAGLVEWPEPR